VFPVLLTWLRCVKPLWTWVETPSWSTHWHQPNWLLTTRYRSITLAPLTPSNVTSKSNISETVSVISSYAGVRLHLMTLKMFPQVWVLSTMSISNISHALSWLVKLTAYCAPTRIPVLVLTPTPPWSTGWVFSAGVLAVSKPKQPCLVNQFPCLCHALLVSNSPEKSHRAPPQPTLS